MMPKSDISELFEAQYPASPAVQGEDPRRAMVTFHQRSQLVEVAFLCSAKLTVASCSSQPHENFGKKLKIQNLMTPDVSPPSQGGLG